MLTDSAASPFIAIIIQNKSSLEIQLKNVLLTWGIFHAPGDEGEEMPVSDHEGHIIPGNGTYAIYSSGTGNVSGTEGSFELYDLCGEELIRRISWDCPWSGSNKFVVSGSDEGWKVEITAIPPRGPIGTVTVTVSKM